ncbi:MAG: 50S ribosome-binding GTPase, partial [Elusimicrobiales bacterium]|nr:50S ribosome-binding GTPase [Elusimicrobiales bacterium]
MTKNKELKEISVVLAGNPNSGKTSLFNGLVGRHLKVGNWAGVTIEKYEGFIEYEGYKIKIVDLPGTYSLTAYSPEEVITRNYIIEENPDVIVNVL